jgi:tetratricopeptide (TPR) repeat protein
MALLYDATGQPGEALALYEQALPIMRDVGDRAGEAVTCFNLAMLYRDTGEDEQAIEHLRRAVQLKKQVQHPDYAQDAATLREWEQALREGKPLPGQEGSSSQQQEDIETIQAALDAFLGADSLRAMQQAVETHQETLFRPEVKEIFQANIQQAQQEGKQEAVEMMVTYLGLLEACQKEGIKATFARSEGAGQTADRGMPGDFVERCISGITGVWEQILAALKQERE